MLDLGYARSCIRTSENSLKANFAERTKCEVRRIPMTRNSKRAASEQEAPSYQQEGPQDQPPASRQDPFQQLDELLNLFLLSGGLEAPAFGELPRQ
jgi:hypothetical protein